MRARANVEFWWALCSYERGAQLRNAVYVAIGSLEYKSDPTFLISFQPLEALTMGKFKFKNALGTHATVSTLPRHKTVMNCPVLAYTLYTITDLCLVLNSEGLPRLLSWIRPGNKDHWEHKVSSCMQPFSMSKD